MSDALEGSSSIVLPDRRDRIRFFVVATTAALLALAVVLVTSLVKNDGHLVYVLDDAGIHLSIARQLAEHGTWGVTNGIYVSASSSPAWTLALAGLMVVSPVSNDVWPLVLNVGTAIWILWLFAANQNVIRPRGRAIPSWIAAILLPVFILFLPAMAVVGMEHLLHAALGVQILVLVWKLEDRRLELRTIAPLIGVVFIAGAVRFETNFLAIGIILAIGVRRIPRFASEASARNWTNRGAALLAVLIGAASALPLVLYGIVNRAFGAEFLPNSIAAKKAMTGRGLLRPFSVVFGELFSDAVLMGLVLAVLTYVVFAMFGGPRRTLLIGLAFLVATFVHGMYGDMRYYDRYQTYLVIAGAFIVLVILGEIVTLAWRNAAVTVLALAMVATALPVKIPLVFEAPLAMSNTYRQRYQLGRFFGEYYAGQTVATGELGYVTYLHNGGIVDLLGLGSPEVTAALRARNPLSSAYLEQLMLEHKVAAIGIYPATIGLSVPQSWYFAGEWDLNERQVSTFGNTIAFYAPTKKLGRQLKAKLRAFEPSLPSHVQHLSRKDLLKRYLEHTR